jgi:hypothetical protein
MATFGVLQQLLAQVFGLALIAALFALLMRPELYTGRGARIRDIVPIFVLATGLVFSYVELVPEMGLAYVLYLGVLRWRKQLALDTLARLWLPVIALVVIFLNSYFFKEIGFVKLQSEHGLSPSSTPPLFGYVLVPSALPGIFGLQTLPPDPGAPYLELTIAVALVAIVVALVASLLGARRGIAAAAVLLVEGALVVPLAIKSGDFGVFKLTMYVQPFLAVLVAVGLAALASRLTTLRKRALGAICVIVLGVVIAAQLSTQRAYVNASRDPSDVPNLSSPELLPAFRATAAHASSVVSVTTNPVLIKLEAAGAERTPLYFQSRDVFLDLLKAYKEAGQSTARQTLDRKLQSGSWTTRSFALLNATGAQDSFEEATKANEELASGRCTVVLPGVGEEPLNHYSLANSAPDFVTMPCGAPRDVLAFTSSKLGESFYLPFKRQNVSYDQLQADPFDPSRTMVGFGRYALFRVLGWTPGSRMVLSVTTSLIHDGKNELPPAAVVGASRVPLPLVGRGSARVFSQPLVPQMINGIPYLLLDMGVNGHLSSGSHSGLQGLWGRSVATDPNYVTTFVRDISLVSAGQYAHLQAPLALSRFPADLYDADLEYSGIYEDGWMGGDSYVGLAGGPKAYLVVRGQVPAGAGKHLVALVNGRPVASEAVAAGPFELRVPVPASSSTRRVELHFAATIRLKAPDLRPAAILLSFLGFTPR